MLFNLLNFSIFRKKNILLYIFFFICLSIKSLSQDIQFSQYYAAPLFLNPAYAGSSHKIRGIAHQRLQWPKLEAKFITSHFSADMYFDKYQSGAGIYFIRDLQGSNTIKSTEVQAQYSYELHLNKEYSLRFGLQFGLVSRFLDYSDLRFPSQFNDQGFRGIPHGYQNVRKMFPDVSSGFIFYNDQLWVSFSGHHINYPDISVLENEIARLPGKFTFSAGYKFHLNHFNDGLLHKNKREISLSPTFNYKSQGKSDQFDIGLYSKYDIFLTGLWYRGIPFKRYSSALPPNHESIIGMIGFKYNSLSFRYSYDYIISTLIQASPGGAHEFNITYLFDTNSLKQKDKPRKRIPCPDFMNMKKRKQKQNYQKR